MSVPVRDRKENSARFLEVATLIDNEAIDFVLMLSPKYYHILQPGISRMSSMVVEYVNRGNDAYNSSEIRKELREKDFLEARGCLKALNVFLKRAYDCLNNDLGNALKNNRDLLVSEAEAKRQIGGFAQRLGGLINEEYGLLTGLLKK